MSNKGYNAYTRSFKRGLKPDPKLLVSEWAERYRTLPRESSAEPGKYRTSRTPFMREIMDSLSPHRHNHETTFIKGTQIGGTEAGNNWLFSIAHSMPGPCMMVLPTVDLAEVHSKSKVAPSLVSMKCLKGIVSDPKSRTSGNTLLLKEFPGGFWRFSGANSAASFRSASIRFLFLDDMDGYPPDVGEEGDPVELAKKRTDAFASMRKIFYCSTPTLKGLSRIEKQYILSDQSLFYLPCPFCGKKQPLEWGGEKAHYGIKWKKEKHTGEHRPETAVYRCKFCHRDIEERYKTQMLQDGEWVAKYPKRSYRHRGFKVSSLYAPIGWVSWEQIIREFLEAKNNREKLKVWTNTRLAETWEDEGSQPEWSVLQGRAEPYHLFTIPPKALVLTAGVDTQDDRLVVLVKGWGRGEESWVIWWGEIYGRPDEDETWVQLDNILFRKEYKHPSGVQMNIICTAIDTGGHYTHDVYNYVRNRAGRVIAIKGSSLPNRPILGHPTKQDVDYRGQVIKNGVQLWPIGTDTAKTRIYARLGIKAPGPGRLHFSTDLEEDYYIQLTVERKTTRFDKKGHPIQEWIKPSGARNEALDCEVYALAAAIRAGIHRANWSQIETSYGLAPTTQGNTEAIPVKLLKKKASKKGRRISSI